MAKFRKRPVVIEAIQLTHELALKCLSGDRAAGPFGLPVYGESNSRIGTVSFAYINIDTLEGTMKASLGDWIIRGVQGEIYPCKPDIFAATYEAVEP